MAQAQKSDVQMYSIVGCPFCDMAKELLERLEVDFEERDLSGHPDRRSFTHSILPGHRTVPLVIIDGDPIGGWVELERLHRDGRLGELLFEEQ